MVNDERVVVGGVENVFCEGVRVVSVSVVCSVGSPGCTVVTAVVVLLGTSLMAEERDV